MCRIAELRCAELFRLWPLPLCGGNKPPSPRFLGRDRGEEAAKERQGLGKSCRSPEGSDKSVPESSGVSTGAAAALALFPTSEPSLQASSAACPQVPFLFQVGQEKGRNSRWVRYKLGGATSVPQHTASVPQRGKVSREQRDGSRPPPSRPASARPPLWLRLNSIGHERSCSLWIDAGGPSCAVLGTSRPFTGPPSGRRSILAPVGNGQDGASRRASRLTPFRKARLPALRIRGKGRPAARISATATNSRRFPSWAGHNGAACLLP